jgi:hypothetical protein
MNWLEILFFPMFLLFDVAMVVLLFVCAAYSWKIYREIPAPQILALLYGWVLIASIDVGFVVVDLWPPCIQRAQIAEAIVALRILPIVFLAYGMYGLYKSLRRAINGKK